MKRVNTTENLEKRMTDYEIDSNIDQIAEKLSEFGKVSVMLPAVEGKPSAVEVCYNGYVIRIKRGVPVEVPVPVYLLLKRSEKLVTVN
jgi:hypothetical protein